MKPIFLAALFLVVAIGGGAASVWLMLEYATTSVRVGPGPWTISSGGGERNSDPYSFALRNRQAGIPFGRTEGLTLKADQDSNGESFIRRCNYRVMGEVENARFWTLHAIDEAGELLENVGQEIPGLHSQNLTWNDRSFTIDVSRHAMPGNWLPISGQGSFSLVLTLFETPLLTTSQLSSLKLPQIFRTYCNE